MHIFETPSDACVTLLNHTIKNGVQHAPRNQLIKETLGLHFRIEQPYHLPVTIHAGRNLNHAIGTVEALNLLGQTTTPELLASATSVFNRYMNQNVLHGAYGPRVHGLLDDAVQQIEKDRDTRQAVIQIYNSRQDLNRDKNDIPCTIALQYFLRNDQLHAHTYMRSNDLYLGLPYDLFQFISLQDAIAGHFDTPIGHYTHTVGSAHVYQQHWQHVDQYTPKWTDPGHPTYLYDPRPIGETSQRARAILNKQPVDNPSWFETFMVEQLEWI